MATDDAYRNHLDHLRQWRRIHDRERALGDFLPDQFKKQIAKPYKQLSQIATIWAEHVPADLASHCRLDSLTRGTLKVSVDSAAHRFELDRQLRTGLERQIIRAFRAGSLRRIRLQQADMGVRFNDERPAADEPDPDAVFEDDETSPQTDADDSDDAS